MSFKNFKLLSVLILSVFFLVYSGTIFCMAAKSFAHCGKVHSECEMVTLQKVPKTIKTKTSAPAPNILLAKLHVLFQSTKTSVYNFFEPYLPKPKNTLRTIYLPHAPPSI
ncbi:MAG: hypothetical protein HQ564_03300 [Candidatus Saganbacteria bacterium]|nr:hypothetical protein [Candidatus Saganbacteria bacterium]